MKSPLNCPHPAAEEFYLLFLLLAALKEHCAAGLRTERSQQRGFPIADIREKNPIP